MIHTKKKTNTIMQIMFDIHKCQDMCISNCNTSSFHKQIHKIYVNVITLQVIFVVARIFYQFEQLYSNLELFATY